MQKRLTQAVGFGVTICGVLLSHHAFASALYLGHTRTEQISFVGEREIALDPAGASILASFDLTEDWVFNIDYASLDDSTSIENVADAEFDVDSWGAGLSYYFGNWYVSYGYSDWEDELAISNVRRGEPIFNEVTESTTSSLSVGYQWLDENWQVGVSAGAHFNSWDQSSFNDPPGNQQPPVTQEDKGDSTFITLGVNASYFFPVTEDQGWIVGTSITWNELTDDESTVVSRNGRNISQVNNPTTRARINSLLSVAGSESYGQINLYVSYDISENWIVDLNSSSDFGAEENSQSWSVNFGYFF